MLKVESYRKGIVLSSLFNIFYKGLVFITSLLIAYYFGTEIKMDIYFYAYNTVTILAAFISSVNSAVIIPESMRIRVQQGQENAIKFLNIFIYSYVILTAIISILILIAPVSIFTAVSKYDTATAQKYQDILYMTSPLILLIPTTTLLTDILASYRFFTVPIVAGIVNALFSIVFLVLFHNILDVKSILTGLLVSYSINIALLLYLMMHSLKWKFSVDRKLVRKQVLHNIAYSQTGSFLTGLGSYAPLYFLSGTVSGVIAALNYAQQIVTQTNSFITYQVSVVNRIKLSELYAEKKYKKINEIFQTTVKFLVFILLPISGLLFLYADDIITVLFKRGVFTDKSVELSSEMLRYLALALPLLAINSIAGNLYFAAQLVRIAIAYQIISNAVLIGLIAWLVKQYGYIGYPIAYVAINIANVLVVYLYCVKFFPFIKYSGVLKYLTLLIVLNASIIVIIMGINTWSSRLGSVQMMIIGFIAYGLILLALNAKFRLNTDFNGVLTQIGQKLKLLKTQ